MQNPQDRSLPTLPLWNPPVTPSSSPGSSSPVPTRPQQTIPPRPGVNNSLWAKNIVPNITTNTSMQSLEQSFNTLQPFMMKPPLQQQQQQQQRTDQQHAQLQQYDVLLSSVLNQNPTVATGNNVNVSNNSNIKTINNLNFDQGPALTTSPLTELNIMEMVADIHSVQPTPSPPPTAPVGQQHMLTQMVMMQQEQLQQGQNELKQMLKIVEDLRNEIHRVKVQRQEEQLLIHRMNMQQQQQQQQQRQQQQQQQQFQHARRGYSTASNTSHHSHSSNQYHNNHSNNNNNNYQKQQHITHGQRNHDASMRARNHQSHGSGTPRSSQSGGRNARCQIDIAAIKAGTESRTTVMVCNIPNRYTRSELMDEFDAKPELIGTYNFLYLPIDFKNNCNLGYAFVNMRTTNHILILFEIMQGSHWELSVRSSKICKLKWGRVQGKDALLGHFLGTMHLNDTPCGFKPVTIEIDETTGETIVQEVI